MSSPELPARDIIRQLGFLAAREFEAPLAYVFGDGSANTHAHARHAAFYLAREVYGLSEDVIALHFNVLAAGLNGRSFACSRADVVTGIQKTEMAYEYAHGLRKQVLRIKEEAVKTHAQPEHLRSPAPPAKKPEAKKPAPEKAPAPATPRRKVYAPSIKSRVPPEVPVVPDVVFARAPLAPAVIKVSPVDHMKEFGSTDLATFEVCKQHPALLEGLKACGYVTFADVANTALAQGSYAPSRVYRFLTHTSGPMGEKPEGIHARVNGRDGYTEMASLLARMAGVEPARAYARPAALPAPAAPQDEAPPARPGGPVLPDGAASCACML